MNSLLAKIRDYLKKVPSHTLNVPAANWHLPFFAEWQDWSFLGEPTEQLFLGYYQILNGDYAHDPLLVFYWRNDKLTDVRISQYLFPDFRPCDPCFVRAFLETVYERHFQGGAE